MEQKATVTTRRQAGTGLVFLGLIVLLLAAVFFIMSVMQQDSFHLFSGQTHLLFDLALGIGFLAAGFILIRSDKAKAEETSESAP